MTESTDFRIHPDWFWSKERAEKEWSHIWTKSGIWSPISRNSPNRET